VHPPRRLPQHFAGQVIKTSKKATRKPGRLTNLLLTTNPSNADSLPKDCPPMGQIPEIKRKSPELDELDGAAPDLKRKP
jgi:hypothetical protein